MIPTPSSYTRNTLRRFSKTVNGHQDIHGDVLGAGATSFGLVGKTNRKRLMTGSGSMVSRKLRAPRLTAPAEAGPTWHALVAVLATGDRFSK